MVFAELSPFMQNLYVVNYQTTVKILLLFGWFILSWIYIYYLYEKQKETKLLILGTLRAVTYSVCVLYIWLFWWFIPVILHPSVGIDNLLIFISTVYSVLFFVFSVLFITNFTLWIPKFIFKYGRVDITTFEDRALKELFGNFKGKK